MVKTTTAININVIFEKPISITGISNYFSNNIVYYIILIKVYLCNPSNNLIHIDQSNNNEKQRLKCQLNVLFLSIEIRKHNNIVCDVISTFKTSIR